MRSSVKKCPTIVCKRGVWRGLELSIESLPLRRNEPEDENLPVFLFCTGRCKLACKPAGQTQKKVCCKHTGSFLQGPLRQGERECGARKGEPNPDIGGNAGRPNPDIGWNAQPQSLHFCRKRGLS